jgi:phosphoglucosamine mutase
MSNMGLERYLDQLGLNMPRAAVGDRYVLEMMQKHGCNLGGEQSGHIIMLDHNTTGDGLLTAMQLLCAMRDADKPLGDLASNMELFPQKLWNVALPGRKNPMTDARMEQAVSEAESLLGDKGRLSVRMSGTEPKLRIMVEAEDEAMMVDVGENLVRHAQDICRS